MIEKVSEKHIGVIQRHTICVLINGEKIIQKKSKNKYEIARTQNMTQNMLESKIGNDLVLEIKMGAVSQTLIIKNYMKDKTEIVPFVERPETILLEI